MGLKEGIILDKAFPVLGCAPTMPGHRGSIHVHGMLRNVLCKHRQGQRNDGNAVSMEPPRAWYLKTDLQIPSHKSTPSYTDPPPLRPYPLNVNGSHPNNLGATFVSKLASPVRQP